MAARSRQDEDVERDQIVSDIKVFTAELIRTAAVELHQASLWPTSGEWARAQALHEAREWVQFADGTAPGASISELQLMIEGVAQRWSTFIEHGVLPEEEL